MKESPQWMKVQLVNEYGNYADIRSKMKILVCKQNHKGWNTDK